MDSHRGSLWIRSWTQASALLAIGMIAFGSPSFAQVANPALFAREDGVEEGEDAHRSLLIDDLKISAHLHGAVAEFVVTAKFAPPADGAEEGVFSLALPAGAAVTGYALDIDGRMIDGVLVPQPKARAVFESKVRGARDPGVATTSLANVFSTRVYPILPEAGRTIQLKFVAPVHPTKGISLPLHTADPVGAFELQVTADAAKQPPELLVPLAALASGVRWQADKDRFVARVAAADSKLAGTLSLGRVIPTRALLTTVHANKRTFFQINDRFDLPRRQALLPHRVRIYWDRSLSRRDARLTDEIALVQQYLDRVKPASVDLVTFNSSGAKVEVLSPESVSKALELMVYRGGTSFDVLRNLQLPEAGVCLLFSDGIATIDRRDRFKPTCATTAISSSAAVDRGYLRRIARATRGSVIALDRESVSQALEKLLFGEVKVVDVSDASGAKLDYAVLTSDDDGFGIVGEMMQRTGIVVTIARGKDTRTRSYTLSAASKSPSNIAGGLWAAQKLADLEAVDNNAGQSRNLSREFSIASPDMAFLVLETAWDYIEAEITPPKNFPPERLEGYEEERAAHAAEKAERKRERIEEILASWEDQKQWWQTDFSGPNPRTVNHRDQPVYERSGGGGGGLVSGGGGASGLESVVVTAQLIRSAPAPIALMSDGGAKHARTEVELAEWNPNRPYLRALNAATKDRVNEVLNEQELSHGHLPAFYLDVSEWLFRRGQRDQAAELLLSAMELPSQNDETLVVIADRLLRYEEYGRAIWLYERLARLAPELPQHRRSLALALAKRAEQGSQAKAVKDLQRALLLLNEVVMNPWEEWYDGIEAVALMDANVLLARLKALGGGIDVLDKRLVALLDVDIRVVVQWNTAATDMDLWVDEPTKERAIYSNPETAMGGRLSNDMTSGFGPEEYLLRRAKDGTYEIRMNIYANDTINPNGATIITAHLFRDFGRPTQTEEVMDIELLPEKSDDAAEGEGEEDESIKLVGKFVVSGHGAANEYVKRIARPAH